MAQADSPPPKFRRRAEERPDEVLDAAISLFVEQGYARTSVAQIAAAAGISKGAVYLYFPSKRAILEGLVQRAVKPLGAKALASAPIAMEDPRAALSAFLHMAADSLSDPAVRAVPRIVIREAPAVPEIAEFYRETVLDAAMPAVTRIIEAGIARGHIRPVDPEMTLRTIVGPIVAHLLMAEVFGIVPARGLAMHELIENHLDILTHGLFPQPEPKSDD